MNGEQYAVAGEDRTYAEVAGWTREEAAKIRNRINMQIHRIRAII